jgi:integrase/recombinase XerD
MNPPPRSWREAVRAFLDRRRLAGRAETTLRNDRKSLHRLGWFLGWKPPGEVTKVDLERFLAHLAGRVKRATARLYLFNARVFFRSLAEEHEILLNPAEFFEPPRRPPTPFGKVLSPQEVAKLIDSIDVAWPVGVRDRALLELLYATGLRAFEVRRLRLDDVDLKAGTLSVRLGKGAKDRVVPLTRSASTWLRRYVELVRPRFATYRPDGDALFLSRWGRAFSQAMIEKLVARLGAGCHVIRRSMATHLLQGGASPSAVAGILGHSGLRTLHRYVARAGVDLKAAHRKSHPREADRD